MPSQLLLVNSLGTFWVSGCILGFSRSLFPLLHWILLKPYTPRAATAMTYCSSMSHFCCHWVLECETEDYVPPFQGIQKDQVYRPEADQCWPRMSQTKGTCYLSCQFVTSPFCQWTFAEHLQSHADVHAPPALSFPLQHFVSACKILNIERNVVVVWGSNKLLVSGKC